MRNFDSDFKAYFNISTVNITIYLILPRRLSTARYKLQVLLTSCPQRTHWIRGWVDSGRGMDFIQRKRIIPMSGIKHGFLGFTNRDIATVPTELPRQSPGNCHDASTSELTDSETWAKRQKICYRGRKHTGCDISHLLKVYIIFKRLLKWDMVLYLRISAKRETPIFACTAISHIYWGSGIKELP